MEKSKLYYYYWGLLSDEERRTVDAYLADPVHRNEYEMLAQSFSAISSILGTDRYRKKRIPFDAVKSAYRRRKAARYAKMSAIAFAVLAVAAAVVLALGYYLFPIQGRTDILAPTSDARIGFVERRIAVEDAAGNVSLITRAGRPLMHDETVFTDENGTGAVIIGSAAVLLGRNTRMVMHESRIRGAAAEASIELMRGSLTVYELPDSPRHTLVITTTRQRIYAERGYRFSVRREGNEERIVCESGTIRMGRR
ncbi:MAG: hypothetical protein AABZ39_12095 [Spirochaetota bacterium]